jgi:hypothetical protein
MLHRGAAARLIGGVKMRRLLWVDAIAAGSAGVLLLMLRDWLAGWYGFALAQLWVMALVSLCYCAFGLFVLTRRELPLSLVRVLFTANFAWASVCAIAVPVLATSATIFGLAALLLEALFVGGLATLERRRWRALMSVESSRSDRPSGGCSRDTVGSGS